MDQFSFIFTIFFMLLGPLKLIPSFAGLTRGADTRFKRDVAVRAIVIAAALCVLVVLGGGILLSKYKISLEALRIAAGLVLLVSALLGIFGKTEPPAPRSGNPTAIQLAASPIAVPGIVPPAGVAALLIGAMLVPGSPGMMKALAISLVVIMVLDFVVMFFIDRVLKTPGLAIILKVLGSVLAFVQVGLAMQIILNAFQSPGAFQG